MGKYMLVVGMNCDPAKEADFNEWYNTIHLPDVLEIDEFKKAHRWGNIDAGEGDAKFLALYEIETDDINATMKALEAKIGEKAAAGRMSNLGVRVIRGTYEKLAELGK